MKTFKEISGSFRDIFLQLTTKGEALLELENKEKPLEEGVDIKIKLVGNKYFDIRSLSGGEKSLAALAFIFAIQDYSPAVFYLLDEVDAALDKMDMFVVSDHGMVDVSSERLISLDEYINRMDDIYINGNGSHVQFDIKKNHEDYAETLMEELINIPNCQAWEKDKIPKRFQFINDNTGDYLLLADEGWFITTKTIEEVPFTLGGMHGYDPALQSMHGIFYAVGVSIREAIQIPAFENIHIYPLICSLLDISPYDGEDSSQGDIKVLEKILIKDRKK